MTDGCFRQVEYAGVLAGTKHPAAARARRRLAGVARGPGRRAAVDVRAARPVTGSPLPKVFTDFAAVPLGPAVAPARRHRRAPRGVGRRLDGRGAALTTSAPPAPRTDVPGRSGPATPARGHGTPCGVGARARPRASSSWSSWPGRWARSWREVSTGRRSTCSPGRRRGAIAWFTLWQALVSTGLTLVLGLPIAFVLHRYRLPGRRLLLAVVTVPFVLPTVVVGTAFRAVLPAPMIGTVAAILLAHVFFNIAVVVRVVGGLWAHLDPRYDQAARTLGASPWYAFRTVTWPLVRPAVARRVRPRLLLHLHLLRGRPRARRARPPDPRGGDLPTDRPAARPVRAQRRSPSSSCSRWLRCSSCRPGCRRRLAVRQRSRPAGEVARTGPRPGARGPRRRSCSSRSCSSPCRWWRWWCARSGSATTGGSPGGAPCSPHP